MYNEETPNDTSNDDDEKEQNEGEKNHYQSLARHFPAICTLMLSLN
jgi:hypothetical protein